MAILTGTLTRWVAFGLALFSVASAFLFHFDLGDPSQFIHFMKNIAIDGGFLLLIAHGAATFSIDGWLAKRRLADSFGARSTVGGAW